MAVHAVEEELVRSKATRAYVVGYLLALTYDVIRQLGELDEGKADLALKRLEIDIYPLIEKEFYAGVIAARKKQDHVGIDQSAATGVERAKSE